MPHGHLSEGEGCDDDEEEVRDLLTLILIVSFQGYWFVVVVGSGFDEGEAEDAAACEGEAVGD